MTPFDLLFLLVALATVLTLARAGSLALIRRRQQALRVLRNLAVALVGYIMVGLTVSLIRPQRVIALEDPWCLDDWCLTVTAARSRVDDSQRLVEVDLRLSSRARRTPQRARFAWVYLIDQRGRRYSPDPEPSAVALNVVMRPQEAVYTTRTFRVPPNALGLGLVTGHGGPYCGPMDLLVVGASGCVFRKPTMIRIP